METDTVQPQKLQQEWVVSPEKGKKGYLLRRADSFPISVKIPEEAAKNLEKRETRRKLQSGSEKAGNILLKRKLEPKSVLKLTMPEGNTMYFETVAGPYAGQEKPNSIYVEQIPISEEDFRVLSEKRKTYELYNLPMTRETSEKFGIEETIPAEVEEELISKTSEVEGVTPTPKQEVSKEDVRRVTEKLEGKPSFPKGSQQSFEAKEGKKIDPERLRQPLENANEKGWQSQTETEKATQAGVTKHIEAKGGLKTLRRIEQAREHLRQGNYEAAEKIAKEMRQELPKPDWANVPEEAKNYIPPSQRPRETQTKTQQEEKKPIEGKAPQKEKKNFLARLFGL